MQTREIFVGLDAAEVAVFYGIALVAILAFLWGLTRHVVKYRRAAALATPLAFGAGVRRMIADILSHRTLRRRDSYAGHVHAGIFFGFVLLLIGTATITLEHDFLKPLFGVTFWKGRFYLLFSLVLDLAGLVLIVGILLMMVRRAVFGLAKLDYARGYRGETTLRPAARAWRIEDWVFLVGLLLIAVTGFVLEGARLLIDRPAGGDWSPIGVGVARLLAAIGLEAGGASTLRTAEWWGHGVIALAFVGGVTWYKAKHMVAVLGSLALRDPLALRRLPRPPEARGSTGIAAIDDFSWKDMLNLDACTKCGRCHEACPARTAGYPLSPRDLVLDLRLYNNQRQGRPDATARLVGDIIAPETLWACRSCGACQEICPVGIEHPTMIVEMRRQLVERGEMDPLLQGTLDAVANTGNSFGESSRKRPAWTRALEFPVKDIRRDPAEVLWFVGDYASYDPRNQKVSQAVARLLRAGGVDFGLLQDGERTAGNDIRRIGEEGLYESLAEHNLEQMRGADFSWIVTTDPHSYNTIKNEYPEFGDTKPIRHYSDVLAELLRTGRLKVVKPLGRRVTFHDPCHLGRLNGDYEAPRAVLAAIGCELVEMPRNRGNSFCCGAGGGRIWIPDQPGTEKPSENRMHEAAALGVDVFVTCCPKDMTMFEDARKTSGHEKDLVVSDLAELVAEAVDLGSLTRKDLPDLAERIADAVANRIAGVVAERIDRVLAARLGGGGAPAPVVAPAPAESAPAPVAAQTAPAMWRAAPVPPAELPAYDLPAKAGPRLMVAVKHVAVLGDEHAFTADGRDIQPDYLEYALNEWDESALEEALLAVERIGAGEVVAVAVGPVGAEDSLRKALAKGAHRAVRVWHDSLTAADPVTVARALAGIARHERPDLILAGVQSSDHAHGATGTALARILGLPHAAVAVKLDWDGANRLSITRELEGGVRHMFEIRSPAVVTIQTGVNQPRYATMRMIKQAKTKPLAVVDGAAAAAGDYAGYVVRRMYTPQRGRAEMFQGSADEVAGQIAEIIRKKVGE